MKLEPFTKNVRAQFEERTRGEEFIALAGLAASVCIVAFLGQVTQRALFLAFAVPLLTFAALAYRNACIFADIRMPHRRQRSMAVSVILVVLAIAVIVAEEIYVKSKGVV